LVTIVAAIILLTVMPSHAAFASSDYISGSIGSDISYPLCQDLSSLDVTTGAVPAQFGVIGVNGGRAFTPNGCFADEYQALASQGMPVSFYLNLSAPRGQQAVLEESGSNNACDASDQQCLAYHFGWNAAHYAATYVEDSARARGLAVGPTAWWLDVETANYWSRDTSLNDPVIQGAIDYFQQSDAGSSVGVYSIRSMWNAIAGAGYRPNVPLWIAGAKSLAGAGALCNQPSFTAGLVTLVQYATPTTDFDYAC
jgi:hypothetical protein